jgi:uncharacterized protein
MSFLKWITFVIAALYLLAITGLYLLQRHLLYFPPHPGQYEAEHNFEFQTADKIVLRGWVVNPGQPEAIIFYGGNAERIDEYIHNFKLLFPAHTLYFVNYRGYGESDGQPSEKSLYADALAVFDKIKPEHQRIDLIGKSLGSGIAVYVAAHRPVNKVALITPYDSIVNVAKTHYPIFPIGILLRDKYESWKYAGKISVPVLILSAENDQTIPAASTQNLAAHIKPALLTMKQIKDVDHNSISDNETCYVDLVDFFAHKKIRK